VDEQGSGDMALHPSAAGITTAAITANTAAIEMKMLPSEFARIGLIFVFVLVFDLLQMFVNPTVVRNRTGFDTFLLLVSEFFPFPYPNACLICKPS
jgi:hypothetical protein